MMWKWNERWNLLQKTYKTFSIELCLVLCRDVMWHFCLHVLFLFFITLIVTNANLDERIGNQTLCFKTVILTLPLCYYKNFQNCKAVKSFCFPLFVAEISLNSHCSEHCLLSCEHQSDFKCCQGEYYYNESKTIPGKNKASSRKENVCLSESKKSDALSYIS